MIGKSTLLLFIFVLAVSKLTFAHGDEHGNKNHSSSLMEDSTPLNDSIYAVGSEENEEMPAFDNSLSPFSTTDILKEDDSLTGIVVSNSDPMIRFEKKTAPKKKHSQHEEQKQHVEKATHEWVSPQSKGHRVAVGITVVSGLAFAALSFFRIGERKSNDPP